MINRLNILKFIKYLQAMAAGMCFEYVHRVESDIWYLPLFIGVLLMVILIIDSLNKKQ